MMLLDQDAPGIDRLLKHLGLNLAVAGKGFARSESTKNVGARVGRIIKYSKHAAVLQVAPKQSAISNSTIGTLGEAELVLREMPNDAVGAAGLAEELKNEFDRAANLLVGIDQHAARLLSVDVSDW